MNRLEELKYMLIEELEHLADSGEIDRKDLPTIDTLAHAAKNICKLIDSEDKSHSRRNYSYEGEPYNGKTDVYEGGSRADGYSYRRGRDSMGRFSRDDGEIKGYIEEIKGVIRSATDESTRHKLSQLVEKMNQM